MQIKKAVITGPTGAIGMHLIEELVAQQVAVTAVCRPGSLRRNAIPRHALVSVVECSLDGLSALPDMLPGNQDVWYHFAWEGTAGAARNDASLQNSNVTYALDAVRIAAALGCKVFVGAGSQAEYGHVAGILRPETPCNPDTGYGMAKLSAGLLCGLLCRQLGMRCNWCRVLSVYGPGDSERSMVMSVVTSLLSGERPICTAGDQLWDYLYAKDAARAFWLIANMGRDGAVYCLGSGSSQPLRAYIQTLRDAIDPQLPIGFGELPYYPNQVMRLEADISALMRDTGFVPQYTFDEGIRQTIEWVRMHR